MYLQGDREKQLGIACSPLCDRQTTLVEKSQIGFIDFIVEPSFNILSDMMEKVVEVLQNNNNDEGIDTEPLAHTILEDVEPEASQTNNTTSSTINSMCMLLPL